MAPKNKVSKIHAHESSKTTTKLHGRYGRSSSKVYRTVGGNMQLPVIHIQRKQTHDAPGASPPTNDGDDEILRSQPSIMHTNSPKVLSTLPNVHKRNRDVRNFDDNQIGQYSEAELSQESDAIETLTHLGDRGELGHISDADGFRNNRSPHIGKGILKVPCKVCQGPIAVKVSAHLRTHNSGHDDKSKICQKCFNDMCKKNPKKLQALQLLARAPAHNELSFPWAMHIRPYSCTQTFSDKYDFKVGNQFQIIYNYTLKECISLLITIKNLYETSVDLIAQAPADEFETMKRVLGREVYHDSVYNNTLRTFEWKMPSISKNVLLHSKLLSSFQEHTGTIQGCNMLFSNNTSCHNGFTTSAFDPAHPVLYPFKDLLDFPVDFPNKIFMELISCSGGIVHPLYTHVVFNRDILFSTNNDFGINVVAVNQKTNTIYMSMKYVALEELNGEASTKLLRMIFKANGSETALYPFRHMEERKFAFSPHKTLGSPDFKVLTHLYTLFSRFSL